MVLTTKDLRCVTTSTFFYTSNSKKVALGIGNWGIGKLLFGGH